MMNGSDHSDTVSLAPSWPPTSPKRGVPAVYYVQSPSRDSHEEDKSSSNQGTTPTSFRSLADSPTTQYHSSSLFGGGRHSRLHSSNSRPSSASRVSSSSGGGKGGRKRLSGDRQRWRTIEEEEEGEEAEYYVDPTTSCHVWGGLLAFVLLFSLFCLVIWGASRPFIPRISVERLIVHDFHTGEGSDATGVATKLLTVNSSLTMRVHNPATFFSIHVSSTTFELLYYNLVVASGQMEEYSQPRKSWRDVTVDINADKVPLYGASTGFTAARTTTGVPMKLVFDLHTKGYVVGKLVKSKHRVRSSCLLLMTASHPRTVEFPKSSCQYH